MALLTELTNSVAENTKAGASFSRTEPLHWPPERRWQDALSRYLSELRRRRTRGFRVLPFGVRWRFREYLHLCGLRRSASRPRRVRPEPFGSHLTEAHSGVHSDGQ